jgi:hypothetical protein
MPRTKLDRLTISQAEKETRIIKAAMARNGLFKNKDLAEKIGTDPGYLSHGFKKGFSDQMKKRMHKVLRFTDEEKEALGEWTA